MAWWEVLLYIILALVILFIVICIMGLIFYGYFKRVLTTRAVAINNVLRAKYDFIKELRDNTLALDKDIKVPSLIYFDELKVDAPMIIGSDQFQSTKEVLSVVTSDFTNAINLSPTLSKNEKLKGLLLNIEELDASFRSHAAQYNSDVVGYNYWIQFIPTRFIFKLAKVQAKSSIL
ncbi:MAG: hypothetical protein LUC16_01310 [Coprobacillus sp.]|nr:hypothetical protein [Coprobacillus sp.]